jgi:manganese/zinc/iron transport system permease protein
MNPYWELNFFQFFPVFFGRLFQSKELAPDEIQVFVLALISIASALIGSLLVLKRMTMLANSLSHTILLGIVIAYLFLSAQGGEQLTINFSVLIAAAVVTGLITTVLTQVLNHVIKLQEDASIGLVFTALFALGIILVTLYTRNAHIGLEIVMGNADALHFNDLKIALGVALTNVFFILLFFKEWKLICFDQGLASSLGFRPALFNYLLMLLTSATAISAFRAVGVLLFLAFLVGLPLTARLLTHNLKNMLLLSCGIGVVCSLVAVALSRHFLTVYHAPLSTSGLVVVLIGLAFAVVMVSTRSRKNVKI